MMQIFHDATSTCVQIGGRIMSFCCEGEARWFLCPIT
jgi:hypothetical protein